MRPQFFIACFGFLLATSACSTPDAPPTEEKPETTGTVQEAWVSKIDTLDNVDGPAIWFSAEGPRVIASAKATDVLIVYDAVTGTELRRVGNSGTRLGQLDRPNGVLVLGDSLLLVVERDNHRVQAFALPSFESVGAFGASDLIKPYGLTAYSPKPETWRVYVTDNYEQPEDSVPPLGELGRRVKWYDITVRGGRLSAELGGAFGDTTAAGAIRITESIMVDTLLQRLMISEEDSAVTEIKEYTLDGRFTGRTFGKGIFTQQSEGIALWACPDSSGYWVTTDQGPVVNTFHLFDRRTLAHLGAFRGAVTNTTDGVSLTQRPVGPFAKGVFFTAHFDAAISAFGWAEIAQATGARADCGVR
jgi:3-phytase